MEKRHRLGCARRFLSSAEPSPPARGYRLAVVAGEAATQPLLEMQRLVCQEEEEERRSGLNPGQLEFAFVQVNLTWFVEGNPGDGPGQAEFGLWDRLTKLIWWAQGS